MTMLGKKHSEETKRKISNTKKGKSVIHNSSFKKEHIPWNKGTKGIMKTNETSFRKGHIPWNKELKGIMKAWNKGKKLTKEHIENLRKSHIGKSSARKGVKASPELRKRLSEVHKGLQVGKNSPSWKGGRSFEPYGLGWTNVLKESIRIRDNYKCQICNIPQNGIALSVHHINEIKTDLNPNNLISLCRNCHQRLHFNKIYAQKYKEFLIPRS